MIYIGTCLTTVDHDRECSEIESERGWDTRLSSFFLSLSPSLSVSMLSAVADRRDRFVTICTVDTAGVPSFASPIPIAAGQVCVV